MRITLWSVYDGGLKIWVDGALVAEIATDQFKYLLADLAQHQKYWDKDDG